MREDSPRGLGSAQGSDRAQLFPGVGWGLHPIGLGKEVLGLGGYRCLSLLQSKCSNLITCNTADVVMWHSRLILIKMVEGKI